MSQSRLLPPGRGRHYARRCETRRIHRNAAPLFSAKRKHRSPQTKEVTFVTRFGSHDYPETVSAERHDLQRQARALSRIRAHWFIGGYVCANAMQSVWFVAEAEATSATILSTSSISIGLEMKPVHAGRKASFSIAGHSVGGDGINRNAAPLGLRCANRLGRLQSVHVRHFHIHQDQIERLARKLLNSFSSR